MTERCVCCGEIIPEGRQVCRGCTNRGNLLELVKRRAELRDNIRQGEQFLLDGYDAEVLIELSRAMLAETERAIQIVRGEI